MEANAICELPEASYTACNSIRKIHPSFCGLGQLSPLRLQYFHSILPKVKMMLSLDTRMIVEFINRYELIQLMSEVDWVPKYADLQECILIWFFELDDPTVITRVIVNSLGFNKFHEIIL